MALLKRIFFRKVKGATIVESLVASVIIITIFVIASLTLNNVFKSSIRSNKSTIENRMNELTYFFSHDKLKFPYTEEFEGYIIKIEKQVENNVLLYVIESSKIGTKNTRRRRIQYDKAE